MRVAGGRHQLVTTRSRRAGIGVSAILVGSLLLGPPGAVHATRPGSQPPGRLAVATTYVARQTGADRDTLALVYQRDTQAERGGLWAGKLLDRATGRIHLVYVGDDGTVAGPELLSSRLRAARSAETPFEQKASPALRAATNAAMGNAADSGPGHRLHVAAWLRVPVAAAERAVRERHPEIRWFGGRPLSSDLAVIRNLRGELWRARRDRYAAAAAALERPVAALGGRVAYASTSAPVVFLDLPAAAAPTLAERAEVVSLGLEGRWAPAMATARNAVDAEWTSGPGDRGNGIRVGVVEYHNVRRGGDLSGVVAKSHSTSGQLAYTGGGQFDHPTWVAGAVAGHAGRYRGIAPGASIVSSGTGGYVPSVTYDRKIIAAADWAVSPRGGDVDIVNTSLAQDTATGAEEARRYFDSIVDRDGRLAISAAGNYATFRDWRIASPGTGYNVLTVGGVDDRGTSRRSDDRIWYVPGSNGSNWVDPPSAPWNRHGDYNKPNLVAPAVGVRTANGLAASGTSVATPIVAGVAAQVLANEGRLAAWPEGLRAVLMAGAVHRVRMPDGSTNVDHEGVGMTSARWSNRIAKLGDGLYGGYRIGVLERGDEPVETILVRAGDRLRVALAWNSHTTGSHNLDLTDTLRSDLDLRVVLPDGSEAGSYTLDNAYETVEVAVRATGYAELHVNQSRFDGRSEAYGLAWVKLGDRTRPSVSRRVPGSGEPWAVASTRVRVVFDEAVKGVDGSSFRLVDSGGRQVPAAVEYRASTRTGVLRPDAALPPGLYTARLKAAITDRAGNALDPDSWRFNVRSSIAVSTQLPSGRRVRLMPGAHVGYLVQDDGSIVGRHRHVLEHIVSVDVSQRATLIGLPGIWLLISSGRWSGYWMRESPRAGVRGMTGDQSLPDAARVVLRAGEHVGYRFDGGRVLWTKRVTVERSTPVGAKSAAVINGRRYVQVREGAFAGYWLPESTRAYRPGAKDLLDLQTTPVASIASGWRTAYRFSSAGAVVQSHTVRRTTATSARVVAWAIINGRPHLAVASGAWAGYWLPEHGVQLP